MQDEINVFKCSSGENEIVIIKDSETKQIYCQIHIIQKHSFFKRIIIALKYVFGYKARSGNWDEFILETKHKETLLKMIDFFD